MINDKVFNEIGLKQNKIVGIIELGKKRCH